MAMLGIGAIVITIKAMIAKYMLLHLRLQYSILINHATFKGALFMITGAVDHSTGTRDVKKLGWLTNNYAYFIYNHCWLQHCMAGVPPFNGFLSKNHF